MLALTEDATTAIRGIVDASDLPEASGLRITAEHVWEDQAALALAFVAEPEPDDQVLDEEGAHVFLEPTVAELLDDKVLDADLSDGRVSFSIAEQDDEPFHGASNGNGPF